MEIPTQRNIKYPRERKYLPQRYAQGKLCSG